MRFVGVKGYQFAEEKIFGSCKTTLSKKMSKCYCGMTILEFNLPLKNFEKDMILKLFLNLFRKT